MNRNTNYLILALLISLFLLTLPLRGTSQNFCKEDGPNWWKRLWQSGNEKRESACFGRYQPKDFNPNTPKVVFDASADNFSNLQGEIDDLADYLVDDNNQSEQRWKLYFTEVFSKADKTEFNDFDYWSNDLDADSAGHKRFTGFFEGAATAKYAAFVYLVGVIKVTDPADPSNPKLMKFNDPALASMGIDGTAKLNEYRDRTLNILEHLKKQGEQDFRPSPLINKTYGHYRFKELIRFLSAFELLRMATTINNRDISLATLKASKLALQGTTRNLFKKTGVWIEGASNNHTLQYAGAMGLAAVILHDCGSGRWKKSWHPDKWANKAHWHIENTLFENSDKTRMTEEDKMAGYAEGPHYFMYGFESLAPFLIAYKNAVPENHTEEVDAGFWRGTLTVHNHDTRQKFHNLYEWYNQIQMPNGWKMPYDNSFTDKNYPYFLKILNHGYNFHQNITSFGIIGQQYHPDVIASQNPLIRKENKLEQHFVNNASGNIVLQSPFSMPDSNRIQIHLLAETGVAVNGGNHEHADANSVVVSAGNELLIFDPGYAGYSYRKWFNRGDDHNIFTVNDDCPSETKTRNATGVKEGSLLITDISAEAAARVFYKNTTVDRKVSYHNSSNQQYVVSMDRTDEDDWWGVDADFKMILSGNGNANDTTFEEVSGENGMFRWTHPCEERGGITGTYNIQTYTAVFGQIDGIEKITDEDEDVFGNLKESSATVNENSSSNYICKDKTKQMSGDEKTVGIHTKVRILKESDNQTHFLTVYWPYKCWQTPPGHEEEGRLEFCPDHHRRCW